MRASIDATAAPRAGGSLLVDKEELHPYKQRFRIGAYEIDPGALSVRADGDPIRLKPKAMAVLVELARQPGVTLSRDELLDRVWKSTHVTPGVVGHAITALRRAFGDSLEAPTYIETIPRIGYRLLVPVEEIDTGGNGKAAAIEAADGDAATSDETSPPPAPPAAIHAGDVQRHRPHRRWPWLMLVATVVALAAFAYWLPDRHAAPAPWLQAQEPRRITFATGSETGARINAGGDWLVYNRAQNADSRSDLVLQSAYGTRYRALAAAEQAVRPAWSANGRRIAYVREDDGPCELRIVGIDDGARERIFRCKGEGQIFFDWNPVDADAMVYAAITSGQAGGSRLALLVNDGGWKVRPLNYAHGREYLDLDPRYSPDGQRIAFRRGGNPTSDIYIVAARGGAVTRLTEIRSRISGFDWLPDGRGIVFSSDHEGQQALYALDIESRRILPLDIDNAAFPDVAARTWAMTYQLEGWRSALAEVTLQGDVPRHRILSASSGRDRAASLSPDDSRIAFVSDRDGTQQLWMLERGSGALRRLTEHAGVSVDAPHWSADGRRLLYVTRARGQHQLWEMLVDDGATRHLVTSKASLRNAVYGGNDMSVWYTAWDGSAWRLHRCRRARIEDACHGVAETPLAWRVDRATIAGKSVLALSSPLRSGELELVYESGLATLKRLRLPVNDGWSVVGDEVWYFQGSESRGAGRSQSLHAMSLLDGTTRKLADFPGLRLLRYNAPLVTRDRKQLIAPAILEDTTDIAFARLIRSRPQERQSQTDASETRD